jgi:hypothetical protein
MTTARRLASYGGQQKFSGTLLDLTSAQRRRIDHKEKHARASRQKPARPAEVSGVEQLPVIMDEAQQMQPERMTATAIMASIDAPRRAAVAWSQKASGQLAGGKIRRRFTRRKV